MVNGQLDRTARLYLRIRQEGEHNEETAWRWAVMLVRAIDHAYAEEVAAEAVRGGAVRGGRYGGHRVHPRNRREKMSAGGDGVAVVKAKEPGGIRRVAARRFGTPWWNLRFKLGYWIGGFTHAKRDY